MSKLIAIVSLLCLNCFVDLADGSCLNLQPLQDFQQDNFIGIWYGFARYENIYDIGLKCLKYNITLDIPNALHFISYGIRETDNTPFNYNVIMTYQISPNIAYVKTTVPEVPSAPIDEMVVATDYATYQIYYACSEDKTADFSWILINERNISKELKKKVLSIFKNLGLRKQRLIYVDQTNCP